MAGVKNTAITCHWVSVHLSSKPSARFGQGFGAYPLYGFVVSPGQLEVRGIAIANLGVAVHISLDLQGFRYLFKGSGSHWTMIL